MAGAAKAPTVSTANDNGLPVTIYSDVICPWCYVGKRRFEKALTAPGMPQQLAISWRPFELNPDMPDIGMERATYRARKFGPEKSRALDEQMSETGRELGIKFAFDKMLRTPNTRAAHRQIWQAGNESKATQNALVNRLFEGYFEEGRDIGQKETLLDIAKAAAMDPGGARAALESETSLEAVLDLEDQGIAMGIRGVPFFLLVNKYAVSGAQPPEIWIDALPQIAAEANKAG